MTELLYLSDTYIFEGKSTIIMAGENEYGKYIILDRTIFYPQGGGQPSDTGTISTEDTVFGVKMVRLNEEGIVYHYGEYMKGSFAGGETAILKIDEERRIMNARYHSAGHLLDIAMKHAGLEYLKPMKGYHFSDGPYVEYSGNLREPIERILSKLQDEANLLIESKIPMIIEYDTSVKSPEGKTPRYAHFEGYDGCGCGGTHVRNSGEIGKMIIRKVKMKDGNIRVGYSIV